MFARMGINTSLTLSNFIQQKNATFNKSNQRTYQFESTKNSI